MGIIKTVKESTVREDARRAVQEGRTVFAPALAARVSGFSGSVSGWAEMIEAIEGEGWRLAEWAVGPGTRERPVAYPLFRRP